MRRARSEAPQAVQVADRFRLREIARHLGWGLHTVQRYARAATWQELSDTGLAAGPGPEHLI